MNQHYTYLLLNIFTLAFPLLLSFDRKVAFFKNWKALFPAIAVVGAFFIIWDMIFTRQGVWEFNEAYLTGIHWGPLPMEEWMFFLTVPYACTFIYECLKTYLSKDWLKKQQRLITWILIGALITTASVFWDRAYTLVTFGLLAGWLLLNQLLWKPRYLGWFYLAYLVHLVPFFLINGILTAWPVVIYNDTENLGIRLGTVPLEDTMYSMLLLLMVINIYEGLKARYGRAQQHIITESYA